MPFTGKLATADSKPGNIELGGPVALTSFPTGPKVIAEINWDDLPTIEFPAVGYTDVTNRVRAFRTQRGRNNFVDRIESGTASIVFDNRDGYFNFTQTGRLLMRKVRLRAFYDSTFFPLVTGHIESYHYSYPGTDFDAVCEISIADGMKVLAQQQFPTTYVRENETTAVRMPALLTQAGIGSSFQSVTGSLNAGQLAPIRVIEPTVPTTQTRSATLTNLSATIVVSSTAGLKPGMSVTGAGIPQGIQILAITDATHFTVTNPVNPSVGYVAISRTRDTQFPGPPGPWYTIAGLSDTKELSVGMAVGDYLNISAVKLFDKTVHFITEIREGEVSIGAAISQTWRGPTDAGGIATGVPFTAPSAATLTFPRDYVQVAGILDHIRQIENTERGLFLVLADGSYQYQGSGYRPSQSVQLTFGENTGAGEIPYKEAPVVNDDTNLANDYNLHNVYTDTDTPVTDATSQSRYFRRSQTVEQLWYDSTVSSLPSDQRVFEPIPRMEGLLAEPRLSPTVNWRKLLNLEISQKVGLRRRPLGAGDIFSAYDQFVESVSHEADSKEWHVTFVTSPAR